MAVKCNLVSFTSNVGERHDPYSWIKIQVVLGKTEDERRRRRRRGAKVPHCGPFSPRRMVGGQVDHHSKQLRISYNQEGTLPPPITVRNTNMSTLRGWLDSIMDSMDSNLSKLWEIVEDRGALHSAVHGVAKSWT